MQIISWNCRGLGNPIKAEAVKDLVKMVSLEFVLLKETKIEEKAILLLSKTKWKLTTSKVVNIRGTSWGLPTLWRDENFQLKIQFVTWH